MERVTGLFTKDIKTMDDLLLHGVKDIYYAENQIVKSLPKLIDKATNRDLSKGLKDHLEETKTQITRLDQVFKKLGQQPQGVQCPAIDGLISEADEIAGEVEDKQVLDAAVIGAVQSVEHYEIARYGTLIADELGCDDVVRLLTTNLNEEKAGRQEIIDRRITKGRQSQSGELSWAGLRLRRLRPSRELRRRKRTARLGASSAR
jgi:ferritin-like metal-binding protein YciE